MAAKGNNSKAKETPEDPYDVRGTSRAGEGAGEYPNYWTMKDRSGNNIGMDATKGHESVFLQHRSGSSIEFFPDGALHITAHNSKYEVIFGEDRMTISGAQDITVKGDASLRVYGDYNVTCHKNYNLTVMGDYNMTSKNMNRHIRGNMDTQAKNVNKKIEGSINYQAHGAAAYTSKGSTTVASQGDKLFTAGSKGWHGSVPSEGDMSLYNEKGDMFQQTKDGKSDQSYEQDGKKVTIKHESGKTDHTAEEEITTTSSNKGITTTAEKDITTKTKSGGIKMKADAGSISSEAQQNIENSAQQNIKISSQQDTSVEASGSASLKGSTTHVGGMSGTTHVVGSDVHVDPGAGNVNLAGGMGQAFGGLNLQMAFEFLTGTQAEGVGDRRSQRADQPQEEADDPWIKQLDRT
jgi:hypothetical protein